MLEKLFRRPLIERHDAARAAMVVTAALVLAGNASADSGSASQSNATVTIGANTAGVLPKNFNPLLTATVYPNQMGATYLMYEPLLQFNLAQPPKYTPWLATAATWSNDGKTLTFVIRPGVKFSNGTTLTPDDVAFTYGLIQKYPSVNAAGLSIDSVTVNGDNVVLNFPAPQYAALMSIASVPIVSKAIWSTVGDPSKYIDANPIGTGPFTLGNFSSQGFTLVRNPNYWQSGMPTIAKVYYPAYTSNTGSLNDLLGGNVDWNANFIQSVQTIFVGRDSTHNHVWGVPLGTQGFVPNMSVWPTNQLSVRKAISLAVDRTKINNQAESGVSAPMANASGLPTPTFEAWKSDAACIDQLNVTAQTDAAKKVLEEDGYKMGSDGFYQKDGKQLALEIINPASFTDYAQADQIAVQNLKAAGINASFRGVSVSAWTSALATGNFQLTLNYPVFGNTPYDMYNAWFNSSLLGDGTSATGDYARVKDPKIDAALAQFAASAETPEQIKALEPVYNLVAQQYAQIPLMTRVTFFNYSTKRFGGWPSADNPYQAPELNGFPGAEQIILNLKPVQ